MYWIHLVVFDVPVVTFDAENDIIFSGRVVSHLLSDH